MSAKQTAKEIAEMIHRRRNHALSRAIGLGYLAQMLKRSTKQNKLKITSLVATIMNNGFTLNGLKRHIGYGLEAIDPELIKVLRS
jgi:hypothetical protein